MSQAIKIRANRGERRRKKGADSEVVSHPESCDKEGRFPWFVPHSKKFLILIMKIERDFEEKTELKKQIHKLQVKEYYLEMTSYYSWRGWSDKFWLKFYRSYDIVNTHIQFDNNRSRSFGDYISNKNRHR